jgi:hypothetical protein
MIPDPPFGLAWVGVGALVVIGLLAVQVGEPRVALRRAPVPVPAPPRRGGP